MLICIRLSSGAALDSVAHLVEHALAQDLIQVRFLAMSTSPTAISDCLYAMFVTNILVNQTGKIEWDKDWHLEVEQCLEYKYTEQVLFETRKPLCIAELWAMGETYQMHELKEWVHNF